MRSEKKVINLFRRFFDVVSEECDQNPEFAQKLEQVFSSLKSTNIRGSKGKEEGTPSQPIPELYKEWHSRDAVEFNLWLVNHDLSILKSTIRSYELDSKKQTGKWKEPKKLADFIVEKLTTKSARGSSFIRSNESDAIKREDKINLVLLEDTHVKTQALPDNEQKVENEKI